VRDLLLQVIAKLVLEFVLSLPAPEDRSENALQFRNPAHNAFF
jgi:hypothetical protein